MQASEGIDQIAAALAKAQAAMSHAHKGATNPHFRSRYADLPAVIDATLPHLNAHGIAVIQSPRLDGSVMAVETRLIHTSGQWLGDVISCQLGKTDPQAIGSATTYLRRYALQAIACIGSDEDDDGERAMSRPDDETARFIKAMDALGQRGIDALGLHGYETAGDVPAGERKAIYNEAKGAK
jgi:hypothetical protein